MTKMVAEHKFKLALACAPESWKYTPVLFKGGFVKEWDDYFFTIEEAIKKGTNYINPDKTDKPPITLTGLGLHLNPITETCGFDFDGIGSKRNFEHHFGRSPKELPPTITTTSGRPSRCQMLFKVPKQYWKFIKGDTLKLESCSNVELRWGHGVQSVVTGRHPNEYKDGQGFYSFVPGRSPKDVELAELPPWVLDRWVEITRNSTKRNRPFLKKETREDLEKDSNRIKPFLEKYYQPPAKYEKYWDWLHVGMSLHHVSNAQGDEYKHFDDWVEWSTPMAKFDLNECYDKWDSFGKSKNPRTFGSLYEVAKENNPETFDEEPVKEDKKKLSREEKIKLIEDTMNELYQLEVEGADWNKVQYLKSVLGGYHIKKDEIQKRLLMMFAAKNGLSFGTPKDTKRRHRTFSSSMSKQEAMEVLQPGFTIEGKDCLLMGESGAGKTLAALGLSYALATGAPILDDLFGISEPKQGATVWVGSDGGDGAFGMVKKYAEMLNVPQLDYWDDNFTFIGADAEAGKPSWGFTLSGLSEIVEVLEAGHPNGQPYKMLVADSLKKILEIADIDFGIGCVGLVMQIAQAIASKYNCVWLWLHHTKPGAAKGGFGIASSGGNSNIYQIPYAVHRLVKSEHKQYGQITEWNVEKFRGEKSRKFRYVLSDYLFDLVDDDAVDADDKTTLILKNIFIGSKTPEGAEVHGSTPFEIASKMNMAEKTIRNRLGILKNDSKLITNIKGFYCLTKQGAKQLSVDCPSIRDDVEAYIKDYWGRL